MERVILTPAFDAEFRDFQCPMEVCDAQSKLVGVFLPLYTYRKLLAKLEIPYSREELEHRHNEQGGISLQDFWRQLGRS